MIRKKKICIDCKTPRYIFSRGRCESCAKKTYKKPNQKSKYVYVRKSTGEKKMFKPIWDTRTHYCTNCCAGLGNEIDVWFFSHIKGKGAHNELRLDPNNVQLDCRSCHTAYGDQGKEAYLKRKNFYFELVKDNEDFDINSIIKQRNRNPIYKSI